MNGKTVRRGLLGAAHTAAHTAALAAALLASALAPPAAQAAYPERPIRLIVGIAAGGVVDTVARILAPHLSQTLGQQVIVDSKPGASGLIAAQSFVTAPADGYTLLFGLITYAVLPHAQKVGFDPRTDLLPLTQMTAVPVAFVTSTARPYRSVADIVAAVKQAPDKVNFATGGLGTTSHLAGLLLARNVDARITFVHYKGGAPALQGVVAGETDAMFDNPQPSTFAFEKAGKLRIMAVMQERRVRSMPDVPTITELGYSKDVAVSSWHGLFGRPGTPQEAVDRILDAMSKALADPEIVAKLEGLGLEVVGSSQDAFRAHFNREYERWGSVIRETGLKLE
ncbi:MAG: Bug family tripartite tricarboxylate transporter substrate binding protein [Lautropia sp.]